LRLDKFNQPSNKGGAKNKDESVPTIIPIIKVKEKYLRVSPPRKKMANKTNKVQEPVLRERVNI
jgi:hypothetical protein